MQWNELEISSEAGYFPVSCKMGAVISIDSWDEDKKRDEVSKSFKHHITWYLLFIRN